MYSKMDVLKKGKVTYNLIQRSTYLDTLVPRILYQCIRFLLSHRPFSIAITFNFSDYLATRFIHGVTYISILCMAIGNLCTYTTPSGSPLQAAGSHISCLSVAAAS